MAKSKSAAAVGDLFGGKAGKKRTKTTKSKDRENVEFPKDLRADADVMLNKENADRFAAWYLGGTDPKTPAASPVFADLAGLPPQLVHVGDAEVLLDDSLTYANKAKAAGVEVTLEVWEDMMHVFPAFEGFLPQAAESIEKIGKFVRRHTP